MKKIILESEVKEVMVSDITGNTPIFVINKGKIIGMVVNDYDHNKNRWIHRTGGANGCSGYYDTIEKLIEHETKRFGYEFVIDVEVK